VPLVDLWEAAKYYEDVRKSIAQAGHDLDVNQKVIQEKFITKIAWFGDVVALHPQSKDLACDVGEVLGLALLKD